MPWVKTLNEERIYKPSIYTKEELPTWSEVYEEFFLKKYFESRIAPDDTRWTEEDPYWKIPRYKFLLATVCNQLNKMIFEDGYKEILLQSLKNNGILIGQNGDSLINDIKFICDVWDDDDMKDKIHSFFVGINCAPPIYTIPHPEHKENPFMTTYQRIDITTIKDFQFRPVIDILPGLNGPNNHAVYEPLPEGFSSRDFDNIMNIMMEPFRTYFEGEGVGWKDQNGHLIGDTSIQKKCASGYDPAL